MSFEECRCALPLCDNCEDACWDVTGLEPPHFISKTAAATRKALRLRHGWSVEEQPDGTWQMLCPDCARSECDRNGHDWYTATLDPSKPAPERPIEFCSRCSIVRRDHNPLDAPPAASPEAATGLLSLVEIAALAAIEKHLEEI